MSLSMESSPSDPSLWQILGESYPAENTALENKPSEEKSLIRTGDPAFVAPVPRLLIRSDYFERSLSLVHRKEWVIGRGKESTIVIPDRRISRRHAIVEAIAPGLFSLIDLDSLNGSFVNQQRVTKPVILQNGDRILFGQTEVNFQTPARMHLVNINYEDDPLACPTVLMTHASAIQGEIWREILSSQGISVVWAASKLDLMEIMKQLEILGQPPGLLLIDLGTTRSNPYDFCRWCRDIYPDLKVILVTGMRTEIFPSERQWAIRQGAVDLLAGFPRQNLFGCMVETADKMRVVLNALEWQPLEQSSLVNTLIALQEKINLIERE